MIARLVLPLGLSLLFSWGMGLVALADVAVRRSPLDKVEPEGPTVKNGRYLLQCPVLLLSKKEPHPLAEAFSQFVMFPASQQLIAGAYIPIEEK